MNLLHQALSVAWPLGLYEWSVQQFAYHFSLEVTQHLQNQCPSAVGPSALQSPSLQRVFAHLGGRQLCDTCFCSPRCAGLKLTCLCKLLFFAPLDCSRTSCVRSRAASDCSWPASSVLGTRLLTYPLTLHLGLTVLFLLAPQGKRRQSLLA